jgi:hypothetical protein
MIVMMIHVLNCIPICHTIVSLISSCSLFLSVLLFWFLLVIYAMSCVIFCHLSVCIYNNIHHHDVHTFQTN